MPNESLRLLSKSTEAANKPNYSSTKSVESTEFNENFVNNPNVEQIDSINNPEFRIENDFSDYDLRSLSSKKVHQIDEWQAAWNVTNAIQVCLFVFVLCMIQLKCK
jgi:hypothetical protein